MGNWIEKLKVGDEVFVNYRFGCSLHAVQKITPAGNIKVNGLIFNANGQERGGDVWNKSFLSKATPEEIKSFRELLTIKKAIKLMRETKTITLEQAETIIDLLSERREMEGEK